MLNSSQNINDLKVPPSNRLEKLSGKFKEYYSIRNVDEISFTSWRSYFSFLQGVKSENSELFKDFYNAVKMEKNKSGCGSYFVIVPKDQ